jgi:hypothetical protein
MAGRDRPGKSRLNAAASVWLIPAASFMMAALQDNLIE